MVLIPIFESFCDNRGELDMDEENRLTDTCKDTG